MIALKRKTQAWLDWIQLPAVAKSTLQRDGAALPDRDPGPERIIDEGIAWLCRAQDSSKTHDGGIARHYSLLDGWSASYPETTGYIIPTMITYGTDHGLADPIDRAFRMLDWLVSIQFPEGGFPGGVVGQKPCVPVTFNTGQILIGLCAGANLDDRYREPAQRAADWLVRTQDEDGCWRRHATPFADAGVKAYETHVSLALFRAASLFSAKPYAQSGLRQIEWALTNQQANGWIANCCLGDPGKPLTHTLGYALRGILEAYEYSEEQHLLTAARRTADGLMLALRPDGRLPGRLDSDWQGAVDWVCLTGTSQIAECWWMLYARTAEVAYRDAARRANAFVRRTILVEGPSETRGAVKGSYPINGGYGRWQYLNWACKFTIDANRAELRSRDCPPELSAA
jgi:hypothetical protein